MAAPTGAALLAAGYTQNPTNVYTQTFGTIQIVFDLRGEPDSGLLTVTPSGDDTVADIIAAGNSLSSLGYPALSITVPVVGDDEEDLGAVGGLQSYSQSL